MAFVGLVGCFPGPLDIGADTDLGDDTTLADGSTFVDTATTDPGDTVGAETTTDATPETAPTDTLDIDVEPTETTAPDADAAPDVEPDAPADADSVTCTPVSQEEATCDGLDDDCDGTTDEGFADTDSDTHADCVDDDDDDDGVLDGVDPRPLESGPNGCDDPALVGTHVGCWFWTVDLPNYPDPSIDPMPQDIPHAVVVTNPNDASATITFEAGTDVPTTPTGGTIAPGASRVFVMPVVPQVGSGVAHAGIRIAADRPVSVMQVNPWSSGASADASLLLPEASLGLEHRVVSLPTLDLAALPFPDQPPNQDAFFVVVATRDGTRVVVDTTTKVAAGEGLAAMVPGDSQEVALERGDVLTVLAQGTGVVLERSDPTGTHVSANLPIVVFAGHEESSVGDDPEHTCCADHLEEQVLPTSFAGTDHVLVPTRSRGPDVPDMWRIVALADDVALFTQPTRPGLDGASLATAGDWIEHYGTEPFELVASRPVLVMQFLSGGKGEGDTGRPPDGITGDPAMFVVPSIHRFTRATRLFAFGGYTSHLTLVRPAGAEVRLDGSTVANAEFVAFGSGNWERAWIEVPIGTHDIGADVPIGVALYGYAPFASYATWGGFGAP